MGNSSNPELVRAFEKELATAAFSIRLRYEREYDRFVFFGSEAARQRFLEQWKLADEARISREIADARTQLHLSYFGEGATAEPTAAEREEKSTPQPADSGLPWLRRIAALF